MVQVNKVGHKFIGLRPNHQILQSILENIVSDKSGVTNDNLHQSVRIDNQFMMGEKSQHIREGNSKAMFMRNACFMI